MKQWTLLLTLVGMVAACVPGYPWGSEGHKLAARTAISLLQTNGSSVSGSYVVSQAVAIEKRCTEPDIACIEGSAIYDAAEGPRHYINLPPLPAGEKLVLPKKPDGSVTGTLPWRIETVCGYLAASGKKPAPKLKWSAWLAHYAADATMPLHCTAKYNGEPPAVPPVCPPNATLEKFHSAYESRLVHYLIVCGLPGLVLTAAQNDASEHATLKPLGSLHPAVTSQIEASCRATERPFRYSRDYPYAGTKEPERVDVVTLQKWAQLEAEWYAANDPRFCSEPEGDLARAALFIARLWLTYMPS